MIKVKETDWKMRSMAAWNTKKTEKSNLNTLQTFKGTQFTENNYTVPSTGKDRGEKWAVSGCAAHCWRHCRKTQGQTTSVAPDHHPTPLMPACCQGYPTCYTHAMHILKFPLSISLSYSFSLSLSISASHFYNCWKPTSIVLYNMHTFPRM